MEPPNLSLEHGCPKVPDILPADAGAAGSPGGGTGKCTLVTPRVHMSSEGVSSSQFLYFPRPRPREATASRDAAVLSLLSHCPRGHRQVTWGLSCPRASLVLLTSPQRFVLLSIFQGAFARSSLTLMQERWNLGPSQARDFVTARKQVWGPGPSSPYPEEKI